MRIIEPNQPTPSTLTACSIPESTVPLWDSGTAYAVDDEARRFVDGAYRIYKALIANTDQDPAGAPVDSEGAKYWQAMGATERWSMFDGSVNSPSVQASGNLTFEYTAPAGKRINALALFNVVGSEITLEASSAQGGGVVYSQTQSAITSRGPAWWAFLFGEVNVLTRFQFFDIPPYPGLVFTVTVTPRGGQAAIGEAVFGQNFYVGEDELGMAPEIKDYSVNRFDDNFGFNVLVRRATRRRLKVTTQVAEERADIVFRRLEALASVRCVFIADKYEAGTIYGFYTAFTPTHYSHPLVSAQFTIEGLI
jgi:hypothetical protein